MVQTSYISEQEHKKHLCEMGIGKIQTRLMWERILIERKKDEYNENRKTKEQKHRKL